MSEWQGHLLSCPGQLKNIKKNKWENASNWAEIGLEIQVLLKHNNEIKINKENKEIEKSNKKSREMPQIGYKQD